MDILSNRSFHDYKEREREEKNGRSPLLYNDANINRQIASEASKEGYELNVDEKQGT